MKNILIVDMDTDRTDTIIIGKPGDAERPATPKEQASILLFDISTLCEAVCTLIHVADQNGVEKSHVTLKRCIEHLQNGFGEAGYKGIIQNP